MLRSFFLLAVVVLATGCSVVPDDIDVPDDTNLVSYNRAVTGGEAIIGQQARWGGIIVGVENKPEKTFVEIVNFQLNHYGKPNTGEETIGRFKVEMDGFVDPIHFEKGRLITFVGQVEKPVAGMVGEQPYMYPLLKADNYHLWRKNSVNYIHPLFFDYRMGWYSPFYYGAYRPFSSPWGFGIYDGYYQYGNGPAIRARSTSVNNVNPSLRSNRSASSRAAPRPTSSATRSVVRKEQ